MQRKFLKQHGIWIDIFLRFFFCRILMLIRGGRALSHRGKTWFCEVSQTLAFVWVWTSGMESA